MKIVISGGTHCGKTALISLLAQKGYATIPDAGMLVIEELNAKLGIDGQREYRKNNPLEFYSKIIALQNNLEKEITGRIIFCDRGTLDYLAMYELTAAAKSSENLTKLARQSKYDLVFVCDELDNFDLRKETGRSLNKLQSLQLQKLVMDAYSSASSVFLLKSEPIEQRAAKILQKIDE